MQDLNDLFYFASVVDFGGFAAASRKLGIPKSRLSRRIGELEQRLGVSLIHRTTRKFILSEVGRLYYRHCVEMIAAAEAADEAITVSMMEPRGRVSITCPPGLGTMGVSQTIARFLSSYPSVQVQLESTNRRVDLLQENYDIALRVRFPPLEHDGLVVKILGHSTQRLVAHPSIRSLLPSNYGVESLESLPSLDLSSANGVHKWSLMALDGISYIDIPHSPRYVTSDLSALLQAALEGVGAVQLPEILVREHIESGRLVELLSSQRPRCGVIHAVFPSRKGLVPAVRILLDELGKTFTDIADLTGFNDSDSEMCS